MEETAKEAAGDTVVGSMLAEASAGALCTEGGRGILEGFLYKMVFVLRPELGDCERERLIRMALGPAGAGGVEYMWI